MCGVDGDPDSWPLLARLTEEVRAADPDLAEQMARAIRSELDFYRTRDTVPFGAIVTSAAEHIEAVAATGQPAELRDAPARRMGEARARDGVALSDVTDALRVGTRFLWSRIVAHARAIDAASDAELVDLATEMWVMHGEYVQAMTAGYRKESAQTLLSRQQERLGLVYGLLTARGREASSPWDAVDRLGLPRDGGFVVVAAKADSPGRMPLPRVESGLAETGTVSAWVMTGGTQLGIVSTADPGWRQRLTSIAAERGASAGVSPAETEYGRIGYCVRLARTALAAAGPAELCFFDDAPGAGRRRRLARGERTDGRRRARRPAGGAGGRARAAAGHADAVVRLRRHRGRRRRPRLGAPEHGAQSAAPGRGAHRP